MDNRSIGIFDSGLGGLTAVKEIMRAFPGESIVYFGDTGRVPYGTRGTDTILKYVRSDIRFLQSFDVKFIIVACGTASAVALPRIRAEFDVPIVGVVDATVYRAVRITGNKRIGVIGTPGTIKSGAYESRIHAYDPEMKTISQACPLFVPLVENGHFHTPVTRLVVEEYLEPVRRQGVDTLILGCTHYPLLKEAVRDYMGPEVALVEPGVEVTRYLEKKFEQKDMAHACEGIRSPGSYEYYVSDNPEGFTELGGIFLECALNGQVNKIDIEKY